MRRTESTPRDQFAAQLEALRKCTEALARRGGRREPSPDVAGEKPREELESALQFLRLAEEELRQQNEDLLAAERALEDERQRYQGLFEFAPCGYIVTDALGIIQEMNRTAELLCNHRRESLRERPLVVLLPEHAQPSFHSHLHRLLWRGAREVETWVPLVEDDADTRVASAEALRSLGYRVRTAENAEQAWELRVRHCDEIALVLTDLVLPGVDGAHLCSALARQGRAPVVAFSGYPIDDEDGRLNGVAYRLQKPVGVERLAR